MPAATVTSPTTPTQWTSDGNTSVTTPNVIPVLRATRRAVRELGASLALSTQRLATITLYDASLSLQVLAAANALRPPIAEDTATHDRAELQIETVSHAIPVIGVEHYLALVRRATEVESLRPSQQRTAIMATLAMAWHAAAQARDWTATRHGQRPELAMVAAYARFSAELALWTLGPGPGAKLLSQAAQEPIRGATDDDQATARVNSLLARAWRLPEVARAQPLAEDDPAPGPSEFAACAATLARAARTNWYAAPLLGCVEVAANRLGVSVDVTDGRVRGLAAEAARQWPGPPVYMAARKLILAPGEPRPDATLEPWWTQQPSVTDLQPAADRRRREATGPEQRPAPAPSRGPRPSAATATHSGVETLCATLRESGANNATTGMIAKITVDGLRTALGFDHALFAVVEKGRARLHAHYARGVQGQALGACFSIAIEDSSLLTRLLQRPAAIYLDSKQRRQVATALPDSLIRLIDERAASIKSVFIGQRAIGLFYADRVKIGDLKTHHMNFKTVCMHAEAAMAKVALAKRGSPPARRRA